MSSVDVRSVLFAPGSGLSLGAEHNFRSGQAIRIRSGLLEGAIGRVLGERNAHRVLVEVGLREKTVTVDVPVEDIETME